jgi:hypothetical protein
MKTFLLATSLLALSGAAFAQDKPVGRLTHLPASTLLRLCQSPQTVKVCDAYVSGISDGITLVESAAGPNIARKVCIPQASGSQLRGALVGWMSKHTDRLSSDVGPVAYDALTDAFPCGAAKP